MAPICTLNNVDETGNAGADEGEPTIPKSLLFNDSLDEGVDPTALLEDADLPTECAAAEPKPTSDLPQKELNDSLDAEDLDEIQLPVSEELIQAIAERKITASIEPKVVTPQADSDKVPGIEPSPKMMSASLEKTAEASSEMNEMPSTESQASKGAKVKPSFGKKKKGFTPPTFLNKAATTTRKSENDKQPEKVSDQTTFSTSDKSPPQNTNHKTATDSTKKQFPSDPGSAGKTSTEEKKTKLPDKKLAGDKKKKEKEKKEQERAQKKQALEEKKLEREKKKAELERQRSEKRLELERKKAEREQKKMEKELKKMEREQKKMEKQTKASHKKQKTKDKETVGTSSSNETCVKKYEVEPSLEKGIEDTKSDKRELEKPNIGEEANQTDVTVLLTDGASEPDQEDKENVPPKEKKSHEISINSVAAAISPITSCDEETKKQIAKMKTFSPPKKTGDQQNTAYKEKETTLPNEAQISDVGEDKNQVKDSTLAPSPGASKSTKTSGAGIEKQKEKEVKKFCPPKAKKNADLSSIEVKKPRKKSTNSRKVGKCLGEEKTLTSCGKKRKVSVHSDNEDDLKAKRSKPESYLSSVWVQCENANCMKWRLLKDCDDPAKVPGKWVCSMNTDPDHSSCSAEEERWSDLGDSQEFVESPFIAGSIVWSKMDHYPW